MKLFRKEKTKMLPGTREWLRLSHLRELFLTYEGSSEMHAVRAPDISPRGMFLNTSARFPEGAVLKIHFRLARSNRAVRARCEVRYCQPGVGLGVEFIDIAPQDERAIREEITRATVASSTKAKRKRQPK